MSELSSPAQPKEGPLPGLVGGILILGLAVYLFSQPDTYTDNKPYLPWAVWGFGIIGLFMILSNSLKLYALKVRKLDGKDADAWIGGAFGDGIVGTIKWGGIAACAYATYQFAEGPFTTLDLGSKTIAVLLAANAVLLAGLLYNTDKIINRLKR